jgi:REP element-mobilizing transposase RayT
MHLEPLTTLSWAWQLHYYLCFRTRSRHRLFVSSERVDLLTTALTEICQRHDYHLLQAKVYPDHLRCLLSLRPAQTISKVVQTIKANSSRECGAALSLLNNGQYFVGQHAPHVLVHTGIERLWQPSAYAGASCQVTTALLKAYLSERE